MSLVYWFLILNFWISKAPALPAGSSDPKQYYAVDLDATNFDFLNDTPAVYAIVEFFAHWCPACRNYKHHYEKVARLFNGLDAVHPDIILMTRVDCALKINTELCDKFSVNHYPVMFWDPAGKFVSAAGWESNQAESQIRVIDDGRTAERLLNWINKQTGSSYGLEDGKFEKEQKLLPKSNYTSNPGQMIKTGSSKFHQLLVAHHHPSRNDPVNSDYISRYLPSTDSEVYEHFWENFFPVSLTRLEF